MDYFEAFNAYFSNPWMVPLSMIISRHFTKQEEYATHKTKELNSYYNCCNTEYWLPLYYYNLYINLKFVIWLEGFENPTCKEEGW